MRAWRVCNSAAEVELNFLVVSGITEVGGAVYRGYHVFEILDCVRACSELRKFLI